MSILTDELCSNLKVQTVSKRQVLGNAFVNDLLTSLLRYGQLNALLLCCSLHRTDAERGDTALGESLRVPRFTARHCSRSQDSTGDIFQLNES